MYCCCRGVAGRGVVRWDLGAAGGGGGGGGGTMGHTALALGDAAGRCRAVDCNPNRASSTASATAVVAGWLAGSLPWPTGLTKLCTLAPSGRAAHARHGV
jgi:hypothetical protein